MDIHKDQWDKFFNCYIDFVGKLSEIFLDESGLACALLIRSIAKMSYDIFPSASEAEEMFNKAIQSGKKWSLHEKENQ